MIWMEIRCSRRSYGGKEPCWSDMNEGPMDMAHDTNSEVLLTKAGLVESAIGAGWKNIKGEGFVCPSCLEQP